MSMICYVLGLSPAQIKALRATPSLATAVAMAELGDDGEDISHLGPLQVALDLQKSWHLLHYLFTGSLDDTSLPGGALLAGEVLGEDVGYGPARLLDEIETAEFARFLAGVELASLQVRVNVKEMAEIGVYAMPRGPGLDSEYDSQIREEVGFYFPRLRDYVVQLAQQQSGLLTWLS
jgi:hypothetical protein